MAKMTTEEQLKVVLEEHENMLVEEVAEAILDLKKYYIRKLNRAVWKGDYQLSLKLSGSIEALDRLYDLHIEETDD